MNYLIVLREADCAIFKTGAAVDMVAVYPSLRQARAALSDRVEDRIRALRGSRLSAIHVRDADLPLDRETGEKLSAEFAEVEAANLAKATAPKPVAEAMADVREAMIAAGDRREG